MTLWHELHAGLARCCASCSATDRNRPAVAFFVSSRSGTFAGGFRFPEAREAVFGEHAMVASNSDHASAAGREILQAGGNAMDAAVAVGFALAVTYPFAGNIGGGGFMVIRMADGRTAAIDYREMAPAATHHDVYLDEKGELIPDASLLGYRAAGVPGTPAGLDLALRKYGTMKWADLIEPARRLAKYKDIPMPKSA